MHSPRRSDIGVRLRAWALEATALACMSACGRPAAEAEGANVEPAPPPSPPVVAAPTPTSETPPDRLLVTEAEYQGWKYYAVYCERCHGPDALGTLDAPDLRFSISPEGEVSADSFRVVVRQGAENREENKVMKGFEDLLDNERIDQLYAYVKARSEGRLAAGRPHRAPGP